MSNPTPQPESEHTRCPNDECGHPTCEPCARRIALEYPDEQPDASGETAACVCGHERWVHLNRYETFIDCAREGCDCTGYRPASEPCEHEDIDVICNTCGVKYHNGQALWEDHPQFQKPASKENEDDVRTELERETDTASDDLRHTDSIRGTDDLADVTAASDPVECGVFVENWLPDGGGAYCGDIPDAPIHTERSWQFYHEYEAQSTYPASDPPHEHDFKPFLHDENRSWCKCGAECPTGSMQIMVPEQRALDAENALAEKKEQANEYFDALQKTTKAIITAEAQRDEYEAVLRQIVKDGKAAESWVIATSLAAAAIAHDTPLIGRAESP